MTDFRFRASTQNIQIPLYLEALPVSSVKQVSWLTLLRPVPPSHRIHLQWPYGTRLAAYSDRIAEESHFVPSCTGYGLSK